MIWRTTNTGCLICFVPDGKSVVHCHITISNQHDKVYSTGSCISTIATALFDVVNAKLSRSCAAKLCHSQVVSCPTCEFRWFAHNQVQAHSADLIE